VKTEFVYPGFNKFSDDGGKAIKGNLIYCIKQDAAADTQVNWFAPNTVSGLTQAGLSRINQSFEAFVYCILVSQVNVRSSILGSGGRAKEAQSEFLVLMEEAIRQSDLAKSVQRYQLAADQAKVRLNLAVCTGAWLMPAKMVINTKSTVGHNNKLKQAVSGMKLGVNNEVNPDTKNQRFTSWQEDHQKLTHQTSILSTRFTKPQRSNQLRYSKCIPTTLKSRFLQNKYKEILPHCYWMLLLE